jgi:hypothetical protein
MENHMSRYLIASAFVLALAIGQARAQYPCAAAPVYAAPVVAAQPFVGTSYAFTPAYSTAYYYPYTSYYPGYSNYYATNVVPPGYSYSRFQARYENPGPYYYTPASSWSPSYYSYYYTPGYFRY